MLAIVGIPIALGGKLRNKTAVFYIANSNCRDAIVSGYTDTKAIDSLCRIFWRKSIGSVSCVVRIGTIIFQSIGRTDMFRQPPIPH